jgi:hypothetical protein
VVDMFVLLLRQRLGMASRKAAPRAARKKGARLLSSYNNNSNNPRRGTDRLRGAW